MEAEKKTKKLIVVLGMHRSGTSLVTQLCRHMGAYLGEEGELMAATKENPDGYFENMEICRLDDALLHSCGKEWYSLEPAGVDSRHQQTETITEGLRSVLQKLLFQSDVVAVKDPRIGVLLPVWEGILKSLEAEIQYIWVVRNPLEVAESLKKRNGYGRRHSLFCWVHYNLEILKYLKGRNYCLIRYQELLENGHACRQLSSLFGKSLDDRLKKEWNAVLKQEYRHSKYSWQEVEKLQEDLVSDLYRIILAGTVPVPVCAQSEEGKQQQRNTDMEALEERYMKEAGAAAEKNIDYAVLENNGCLAGKEIVIYGAANCGRRAAEMVRQIGYRVFCFCDRDQSKQGKSLMGERVVPLAEIEERENLLFVIAVENDRARKEIEQTVSCVKGAQFLSFFVLELVWASCMREDKTVADWVDSLALWYKNLEMRARSISHACRCPILVYQNGKVGSSTVSESLWNAGVKNVHIHRFFFKNDIVGRLILGDEQEKLAAGTNIFRFQDAEYVRRVKSEMKHKKIITMVREPIAVDLSTVFQWIGTGETKRYFAEQLRQGRTFPQAVTGLMIKIQNRLFDWFEEELKELCGINVLAFPFDKEKGYTIISENSVELLLMKAESLPKMTEIIRDFTGSRQLVLLNANVGSEKSYAHLYKEVKKRLVLPKEYVEHYYDHNPYMDHFYSKEEQEHFLDQWKPCMSDQDS
ncbi:MAG: hypothetical protein HFE84_06485 [Lachnospiraceae bacterium]|nr:hypothetical protein [Lachnospiraceae bacterium]